MNLDVESELEAQVPARYREIVLASASPRRRELLRRAGVPFTVRPADIDEVLVPGESARECVERLSGEKALAVAAAMAQDAPQQAARESCWVLGSDTVVVLEGEILGKPRDAGHAVEMLSRLTGRRHEVVTGVAVVFRPEEPPHCFSVTSEVHMRDAALSELEAYVAGGEPMDKAGGYALQGEGARFVTKVVGSATNVIGLPVSETLQLLRALGAGEARARGAG